MRKLSLFTRAAAGLAVIAGSLLGTTAANAASGCSTNCVNYMNTATSGYGATFFQSTTVPTRLDITIYKAGANGIVQHLYANNYAISQIVNSYQMLTPGTDYVYSELFYDKSGGVQWRMGSFTTKHRKLTVEISQMKVTDKGNFWGSGSETFYVRPGVANTPSPIITDYSVTNGDWVDPYVQLVGMDVPTWAPISVEMDDAHCGFCTYGLGADWTTGSDSQHSWVTATYWADTSLATNGWKEFYASNSGPAGINVYGSYKVEFV